MIASQQSTLRVAGLACTSILALLVGCRASLPDRGALRPGTYHQTTPIRYLLSIRTYLVHVPQDYSEERAWPLVLVLHGAFSTADDIEKWSGFSELADREGFVVAYPNGIGLLGFLQHWNAGHCCGRAAADNVDDVGFLNYVIGDISDKLRIDPKRLYVVGHSNGGMLAYHYAAEASARVAGIGVVAGAIGSSNGPQDPLRRIEPAGPPVPLIAIHGRDDEHVPFEGGVGRRSGKRRYVSAFESAASWARHCGCEPTPNVREDAGSGRRVVTWQDSQGHTWVALHALDGWHHEWPGTSFIGRLQQDHPLRAFEASQVIWEFFRRRTQPAD